MTLNKLNKAISEVERDLAARRKAYPDFISAGKITKEEADERIENLDNALVYLIHYREVLNSLIAYEQIRI